MLTKAQQENLDAAFARVGKPSPALQLEIDEIRAVKNKDELDNIYLRHENIERPTVEAELIGLLILSKLAELDPTLNVEALNKETSEQVATPLEYEKIRDSLIAQGKSEKEAKQIAAATWWKRHPGATNPFHNQHHKVTSFLKEREQERKSHPSKSQYEKMMDSLIAQGKSVEEARKQLATSEMKPTAKIEQATINTKRPVVETPTFAKNTRPLMKAKIIGALIFFIECWFLLWCTLGVYLAWHGSGNHPDTDLATIAKIITFISVIVTLFRIPKIKS